VIYIYIYIYRYDITSLRVKQPVLNLTRYIGSLTIEYVMTDIRLY